MGNCYSFLCPKSNEQPLLLDTEDNHKVFENKKGNFNNNETLNMGYTKIEEINFEDYSDLTESGVFQKRLASHDFERIKLLGRGTFGEVFLVKKNDSSFIILI